MQRFVGFDPSAEPIGERLSDFRIATIALVDELEDWADLDTWLEAERALGAVQGLQVMKMMEQGGTIDQRLATLEPFQLWAQALSSNLRHFRTTGFDAAVAAKLSKIAQDQARSINEKHGFDQQSSPPSGLKLKPLD